MNNVEREQIRNNHTIPLQMKGYGVFRGWDSDVATALSESTAQPHVASRYPRDLTRFSSSEAAERWFQDEAKSPLVYSLADRAITGVAWFSNQNNFGVDVTFNSRIYGTVTEAHAGDFVEATHDDFRALTDFDGAVSLNVTIDDERALEFYLAHGYDTVPGGGNDHEYELVREN